MPRNRIIKADFWADEKIGRLSDSAKLLFIGCWTFADDSGVCRANDVYLRNNIFPYDEDVTLNQIREALQELINSGVVVVSEYSGELYLYIVNFKKHQVINKPSAFRYVLEDYGHVFSSSVVVVEEQSRPKVKEKEKGKGKEKVNIKEKENFINQLNENKEFKSCLSEWLIYKETLKDKKQWEYQYKKLKEFSNPREVVSHSIGNGYQGLYAPKDKQEAKNGSKDLACLTGTTFKSKYETYSEE